MLKLIQQNKFILVKLYYIILLQMKCFFLKYYFNLSDELTSFLRNLIQNLKICYWNHQNFSFMSNLCSLYQNFIVFFRMF